MKKIIISVSAAVVILSLFLVGCGDKKIESNTTSTTFTTTTTTTTDKENLEDKITSVLEDATSIFDRETTSTTVN